MERIPCRRCLLSDLDDQAMAATVTEYVNSLLPEEKASEEEYRRRLDCCRRCEQLSQGLCRLCGCFVEARAAGKNAFCPHVPGCW